ncbi:MAG TPA: hypothetical protein VII55_00605 [Candidatus Saccharimonadales bacterium]
MDPSSKSASGIELPLPAMEPMPPGTGGSETVPLGPAPERAPAGAERFVAPGPPPASPIPTIPLPSSQAAPLMPLAPVDDAAATSPSLPAAGDDDGDLIEKAWVDKAKQIVERTRDDPHKQSEAITVFKADYMKKRYGKTIKLSQ